MAALGQAQVELPADIAKFESAMTKASTVAEKAMRQVDKSLSFAKTLLSVLGAGFLAVNTFDKIKEK